MTVRRGNVNTSFGNIPKQVASRVPVQKANTASQQFRAQEQANAIENNNASNLIQSLTSFSSNAVDASLGEARRKIELDKVKQTSRAVQDLAKPVEERLGIGEEATRDGKTAYQLIMAQREVTNANIAITDAISKNPNMTDSEYEALFDQYYTPIMQTAQDGDEDLIRQVTATAQESQSNLYISRKKAQMDALNKANMVAVADELSTSSADLLNPEQAETMVDGWRDKADLLGLDETGQRNMLIAQAQNSALGGNDTLLTYIEGQDWATDDASVRTARLNYENLVKQNTAIDRGVLKGQIQVLNNQPNTPWSSIESLIRDNEGLFSEAEVSSLVRQHQSAQQKIAERGVDISSTFQEDGVPLSMRDDLTSKEKNEAVAGTEQLFVNMYDKLIEANVDPYEASAELGRHKMAWSQKNGQKLPSLEANFSVIEGLNPDTEMTEAENAGIQLLMSADNTTIDMYFPSRAESDYAHSLRDQITKYGMEGAQLQKAITTAYNRRNNPNFVTAEMRTDLRTDITEEMSSTFSSFFNNFTEQENIPEWQLPDITRDLYNLSEDSLYNTGSAEGIGKRMVDVQRNNYSQLTNGTLIRQTLPAMNTALGLPANTAQRSTNQVVHTFLETVVQRDAITALGLDISQLQLIPAGENAYHLKSLYGDTIGLFSGKEISTVGLNKLGAQGKAISAGRRDQRRTAEISDNFNDMYQ